MKKLLSWQIFPHFFLFGIVCLFIVLRLPSLIEPYWYGDEGIYAIIGKSMREGFLLYRDIWDNKPPLLYVFYALVYGELFWIRTLSLIIGTATVILFFKLSQTVLKEKRSVIIATSIFTLLFGLPILEGNIANAENFMLLPICAAFYLVLKQRTIRSYFGAGIVLSIALMIKSVALFDIAALMSIIFLQRLHENTPVIKVVQKFIFSRKIMAMLLGIVSLPLIFLLYYLQIGAVYDFISSTLIKNVGYVGFENHFIFPLGLVFLKISFLLVAIGSIYYFRNKLSKEELILFPWMAFALFSMFFSDRPYTHYMLMGILPFCLLLGYLVRTVQIRTLIVIVAIMSIVMMHFSWYEKNISYYKNYIDYVFGEKKFREYTAFFDRNSVVDYDIAQTIAALTKGESSVYYWSDSAQLYMLTDVLPITKYVVAYHNESYPQALEKTVQQIHEKSPDYIVSTRNNIIPFKLADHYELKYTIESARIYEKRI